MRFLRRVAAVAGALALSATAAGAHGASAQQTNTLGYVYVNDNTTGANTVAGFARNADGTLTPLPGSPFAAGGVGTGAGLGSQGALQLVDHRFLLVADAGSNQISVLRVFGDGTVQPVPGSPFPSNGIDPVSIAAKDNLVYVANAGNGGSNYTGFTLFAGGRLVPLANSTFTLPDGSGPGDVLFNGNGTRLVGVRVNTSLIDSFAVGTDGRLTPAATSPISAPVAGPFGSEFRPTNPTQLFVSLAHGGTNNGSVAAYHDAPDGTLSPIGPSPYADNQTAPCWVEISHDGRYLYTVNTGSDSISRYLINAGGTLTLLGSTTLNGGTGLKAFDARLDPTDSYLYVVESAHGAVGAFAVDNGNLTELSGSPFALPAGAAPSGIVVG